ncbi:MAG: hypothetical protein GY856_16795, partial [bacterium]|nr:hypothetical protein [bacterium]
PATYRLTVSKLGTGSGTVTSVPSGIRCGGDCTHDYAAGTGVTLTATPDLGSTFAGWSGACAGTGDCSVTMGSDRTVRATFDGAAGCAPGSASLCLSGNRFRVEVAWRDFQGNTGSAQVVPVGSDDSGLFWFFDADNWEMLVKVLDGCAVNERYWVFSAATTNVEYTLRVTDTQTDIAREYRNPLGTSAPAVTDATAFATCP